MVRADLSMGNDLLAKWEGAALMKEKSNGTDQASVVLDGPPAVPFLLEFALRSPYSSQRGQN